MAEFSKQYCELWDPEFPWDFDIDKIAKDLKPGFAQMYFICEGFGFSGICRTLDGEVMLYFRDWENNGIEDIGHWISYESFINSERNKVSP